MLAKIAQENVNVAEKYVKPLEKKASDKFEEIRQNAYKNEIEKLGFNIPPSVSANVGKGATWVKNIAKQGFQVAKGVVQKNPVAAIAGGAGLAAGAGGMAVANSMNKK